MILTNELDISFVYWAFSHEIEGLFKNIINCIVFFYFIINEIEYKLYFHII